MIPTKPKPSTLLFLFLFLFLYLLTPALASPSAPKIVADPFWVQMLRQVGLVDTPWKRDLLKNLTRQVKQLIDIENSRFVVADQKYSARFAIYKKNLKSYKKLRSQSKIDQKKREKKYENCEKKSEKFAEKLKGQETKNFDMEQNILNKFEGSDKNLQDEMQNRRKAYETKIGELKRKEINIEARFDSKVENYKVQLEAIDAKIKDLRIKNRELNLEQTKLAEKKTDVGLRSIKVEEKFDRKCEKLLVKLEDVKHDSAPVDAIEISIRRVLRNRPYLEERAKANEKLASERLKILIENFKLQKFELKKVKFIHKIRIKKRKEIKKLILKANAYNLAQIKLMEELRNSETQSVKDSEKVDTDTEKIYMERIQTKLKNLRLKEQWTRSVLRSQGS